MLGTRTDASKPSSAGSLTLPSSSSQYRSVALTNGTLLLRFSVVAVFRGGIHRHVSEGDAALNEIVALSVHDLERRDGVYQVKAPTKTLPVTQTTQRVIDELHDLYNRRASKSYGKFTTSEGYPTQDQIRDYVDDPHQDFLRLTTRMMDTLRAQAQARSASTGGHVFFAHFRRDGRDFLLVSIVSDKISAALTGQDDMQDVNHLDLEGFRFAGRINLTVWADGADR